MQMTYLFVHNLNNLTLKVKGGRLIYSPTLSEIVCLGHILQY
jgi:hypothetical protein